MLENSDAVAVVVEDEAQLEKVRAVRDSLPKLKHILMMEGTADDAISMSELAQRGEGRDEAQWEQRWSAVDPGRHLHDHLHVGHDRPAQGLRHLARQLPLDADDVGHRERAGGGRDGLPLPSTRPQLRAADPAAQRRPRRQHRLLGARPAEDRPQPLRGQARGASPRSRASSRRSTRPRPADATGREEGDLELGDRGRQEGPREGARRRGPRLPARAPVQAGRQARASARSAPSSAATSASASRAPRRSTPRSCASSTRRAS